MVIQKQYLPSLFTSTSTEEERLKIEFFKIYSKNTVGNITEIVIVNQVFFKQNHDFALRK